MSPPIRYTVLALMFVLMAGLGWGIHSKLRQRQELGQQFARLPEFAARTLKGGAVLAPPQTPGPVVLVYFEPDCDHCQRQAVEIHRHAAQFGAVPVLWLSKDSLVVLQRFAQQYGLLRLPTMQVAQIRPETATALGFFSAPDIRVYDADKKMCHRYKGETSALAIINKLHPN